MQWFDGIDAALTKPERALLARLKRQARAGVNVSPYPGYDQYSKLCARYERKADLLRFQQPAASSKQKRLPLVKLSWANSWNGKVKRW